MNELSHNSARVVQDSGHKLPDLSIAIPYRRARAVLWAVTLIVIAFGLCREFWLIPHGKNTLLGIMPLIDLNGENTIAEWWSVVQLLMAAALLSANGVAEGNSRWKAYWYGLSGLFVLLSLDESAGLHERLMTLLEPYHFTGFLHFSWIIPYAIACLLLGSICLPFIAAFPRGIRARVVIAAGLFVGSALGMEAVGGYCISSGAPRICHRVEYLLEESGEMIAVTLFILALLMLLGSRCRTLAIRV